MLIKKARKKLTYRKSYVYRFFTSHNYLLKYAKQVDNSKRSVIFENKN